MGDVHNLQGIIAQSPVLNRLHEAPQYAAANGAQVLNLIAQRKTKRKLSTVQQVDGLAAADKEDEKKRRIKKEAEDRLIDITV